MKWSRIAVLFVAFGALTACGSSADGGGDMTPATLADFCGKCADCALQPGFSEGFCTDWLTGTTFDRLKCSAMGDTTQLDDQSVTVSELKGMSCEAFDDAE